MTNASDRLFKAIDNDDAFTIEDLRDIGLDHMIPALLALDVGESYTPDMADPIERVK